MANKLSDGVGKKIVEALKKQSEIEITPIQTNEELQDDFSELIEASDDIEINEVAEIAEEAFPTKDEDIDDNISLNFAQSQTQPMMEETTFVNNFQKPIAQPSMLQTNETSFLEDTAGFELPENIAVLRKLIMQLPTGVTKHTGALIIRQTMEALGISMKSVLQEAQQVQEGLNHSAKECQNTITEYKRQILSLEKQSQNYQKQYAALNDLISLFIQTN